MSATPHSSRPTDSSRPRFLSGRLGLLAPLINHLILPFPDFINSSPRNAESVNYTNGRTLISYADTLLILVTAAAVNRGLCRKPVSRRDFPVQLRTVSQSVRPIHKDSDPPISDWLATTRYPRGREREVKPKICLNDVVLSFKYFVSPSFAT